MAWCRVRAFWSVFTNVRHWCRLLNFSINESVSRVIGAFFAGREPYLVSQCNRRVIMGHWWQLWESGISCLSNYAANLHWKYQNELTGPHLSAHFLLERQIGDCTNIADFGCYILRSLGIPVGIDTYLWSPVSHVSHVWNVVLDTTGYTIPFNFEVRKLKRGERFGYSMEKYIGIPMHYRKTALKLFCKIKSWGWH